MSIYSTTPAFKPTHLYIKELNGLLYFGKTTQNPYKYHGSGLIWKRKWQKYGKENIKTLWTKLFTSEDDLVEFATFFSELYDIVKSDQWANLKPETGLDGGSEKGRVLTNSCKAAMSETRAGRPLAEQDKKNKSKAMMNRPGSIPVMVDGIKYLSGSEAARQLGLTRSQIKGRVESPYWPTYQWA